MPKSLVFPFFVLAAIVSGIAPAQAILVNAGQVATFTFDPTAFVGEVRSVEVDWTSGFPAGLAYNVSVGTTAGGNDVFSGSVTTSISAPAASSSVFLFDPADYVPIVASTVLFGEFAVTAGSVEINGLQFVINNPSTDGFVARRDADFVSVQTVIPAPPTIAVFLVGLAAFAATRMRRRA